MHRDRPEVARVISKQEPLGYYYRTLQEIPNSTSTHASALYLYQQLYFYYQNNNLNYGLFLSNISHGSSASTLHIRIYASNRLFLFNSPEFCSNRSISSVSSL